MPDKKLPVFTRWFKDGSSPVVTETLFINSKRKHKFRVSAIADQWLNQVRSYFPASE